MTNYGRLNQPGILIFNFTKCQLFLANQEGLLFYRQGKDGHASSRADRDLSFHIQRLCSRLKKLFTAVADGASVGSRTETIEVQAGDTPYRLTGSILTNASTKEHGLLIVVEEEEHTSAPKLNLAYYQSMYKLTKREIQTLELLSKGASYKEIAYTLSISEHTVRDHIKNIRLKLHAEGKCGIMARLIEDTGLQHKGTQDLPAEETPSVVAEAVAEPVSSYGLRAAAPSLRRAGSGLKKDRVLTRLGRD